MLCKLGNPLEYFRVLVLVVDEADLIVIKPQRTIRDYLRDVFLVVGSKPVCKYSCNIAVGLKGLTVGYNPHHILLLRLITIENRSAGFAYINTICLRILGCVHFSPWCVSARLGCVHFCSVVCSLAGAFFYLSKTRDLFQYIKMPLNQCSNGLYDVKRSHGRHVFIMWIHIHERRYVGLDWNWDLVLQSNLFSFWGFIIKIIEESIFLNDNVVQFGEIWPQTGGTLEFKSRMSR